MAVLSRRYSGLKSPYRRRDRNSELRLPYGSCHTFQVAKLRSNLESTRTLSGDMLMKDGYRHSGPRRDRAGTTLTPSCGNPEMPRSSATAGSAAPSSATTSPGRSPSWEKLTPAPKSFPTPVSGSTSGERDLSPYWSDFTEAISSELWLPTETGTDAGHIASGAFGRVQRLCAHLDGLLSRAKLERRRLAKRNKYRAASRMRVRIGNLTDELHHQAARWLVDNFDAILLPTFETSDMARRGARKLRSKSVRSLLTYARYRFQKFLTWKAWQVGKELVLVNEAYTSKTCSWSGEIIPNLGGRRAVAGSDGVRVDRDINGARGIFLRTLGDTPALRQAAQEYIGNCAVSVS